MAKPSGGASARKDKSEYLKIEEDFGTIYSTIVEGLSETNYNSVLEILDDIDDESVASDDSEYILHSLLALEEVITTLSKDATRKQEVNNADSLIEKIAEKLNLDLRAEFIRKASGCPTMVWHLTAATKPEFRAAMPAAAAAEAAVPDMDSRLFKQISEILTTDIDDANYAKITELLERVADHSLVIDDGSYMKETLARLANKVEIISATKSDKISAAKRKEKDRAEFLIDVVIEKINVAELFAMQKLVIMELAKESTVLTKALTEAGFKESTTAREERLKKAAVTHFKKIRDSAGAGEPKTATAARTADSVVAEGGKTSDGAKR